MFFKINFSLRNITRVSNSLDRDHARCSVGPDVGSVRPDLVSNCLQNLSADNTRSKKLMSHITFFAASRDLLITFANSLDPAQARQCPSGQN